MSYPTAPADRWVDAAGVHLHYLEWGSSETPPLVLLYGGHHEAHIWDQFAAALAGAFHIFAFDQRGHGASEHPPDRRYDHVVYAADLAAATGALGLGRFAAVGHSLGGHVFLRFASENPAAVSRFVLADVAPD